MYTPTDEEHISSTFIKNLTFELQKSRNPRGDGNRTNLFYHYHLIINFIYIYFRTS